MKPEPSFISKQILISFDEYIGIADVLGIRFQFVQYVGKCPAGYYNYRFIVSLN